METFHFNEGATMALTAMSIVFGALLMLFIAFKVMSIVSISVLEAYIRRRQAKRELARKARNSEAVAQEGIEGEIRAAIFLALHEDALRAHDNESNVLTITY